MKKRFIDIYSKESHPKSLTLFGTQRTPEGTLLFIHMPDDLYHWHREFLNDYCAKSCEPPKHRNDLFAWEGDKEFKP